ncbi:MAG: hypothetical protein AAF702_37360 [Chloroflexota bacterium]
MNHKRTVVAMIGLSLIFALAIVTTSALLKGHESADSATWILIAIWWVPFSFLVAQSAKKSRN